MSKYVKLLKAEGPAAILFIRLMVGGVFLSEGIQKFLFRDILGAGRFIKLGVPIPDFTGPFVGVVEVICGSMICLGLLTRLAAIPLLIDIIFAIYFTKVPQFFEKGFWFTAHEGRTDYSMLLGLIFLFLEGGGIWSLDYRLSRRRRAVR